MTPERLEKIKKVTKHRQKGIVVLEDIHDPHNAQAVFRTCDCLGFQNIYVIFEKERSFNPVRLGKLSSSSANKWLDFKIFKSSKECFEELKILGYKIYATALDEKSKSIFDVDFVENNNPNIALVMGNEHSGISDIAFDYADQLINIPMQGMVQSLNLSVTAAMVLYEISRQRQLRGISEFFLDDIEKSILEKSFVDRA
jgi:tRNA (guanosine-2'-O-)-methyltransferase